MKSKEGSRDKEGWKWSSRPVQDHERTKHQSSLLEEVTRRVGRTRTRIPSCGCFFCLFRLWSSSRPRRERTRCLSVCRQMEGLFLGFNEGRLPEADPRLPWSLIRSPCVLGHC